MPTDYERREVARRLRETGEELGSAALLWYHIAKALGVRTATDGKTACGMLADLIEPPLQCPHYHSDIHYCSIREDIQPIDRDALLELADEIDRKSNDSTTNPDPMRPLATSLDLFGYARRIREACGEVEP